MYISNFNFQTKGNMFAIISNEFGIQGRSSLLQTQIGIRFSYSLPYFGFSIILDTNEKCYFNSKHHFGSSKF